MDKLQIFENEEFGKVRTLVKDGEPWFVASDVCECLGLANPTVSVNRLDYDERAKFNLGRQGEATVITESGLYAVILRSDKPNAKEFRKWITSEVLPAIRKTGVYLTDEKAYDITHNPQSLADLLMQAGEQLKQKEIIIQEMKPKVLFADAVASSKTSILIGQLAKILTQNGYQIGQNRLFEKLRNDGFLSSRKGADWNMPQQRFVEQGLFEIKESTHIDGNGVNVTTKTVKVTGKGQQYFINKFLGS